MAKSRHETAMRRREFMTVLGCAAAWPLAAHSQQRQFPTIGYLGVATADAIRHLITAFLQGVQNAGFSPDRNVAVIYRWAEGDYGRLPALAAELVERRVDVIVTYAGFPTAHAAKGATATIPIVFMIGGDPVAGGLVSSLNHPGGNITGVTSIAAEIGSKRLEALHQLAPKANRIALLVNPNNRTGAVSTRNNILLESAASFGLQVDFLPASTIGEVEAAFAGAARRGVGALYITPDPYFITQAGPLAELSNRYAVPTAAEMREFPLAGGLMSYGADLREMNRRAGTLVGRILKGDKPADLPVERATKLELVINLKTAKALGLAVPLTLQAVADEVIE
jgi:putative ABC transport system substrate-binding protein